MSNPPNLLNDDGSASMATAFLMSHHAFRRDLARFAKALRSVTGADGARLEAIGAEWKSFHGALHGHHEVEDGRVFPGLRGQNPALAPIVERLTADHRRIDPLLERGDRAFAALPGAAADAAATVAELQALLVDHLALEEAEVVPFLRGAKEFPPPTTDAEADLFAQGFAWSSHGVAQDVLDRVDAMLPAILTSRLPAARAAFGERCLRAWGTAAAGATRTVIPDA
jgi:hypothetical protein